MFIRLLAFSTLVGGLAISVSTHAQVVPEVLFFGKLEQLELVPKGRKACPVEQSTENRVVISNSCGCGIANFQVLEASFPSQLRRYSAEYSIGEWCQTGINLFRGARFLVFKLPNSWGNRWIETLNPLSQSDDPFDHQILVSDLDYFFHVSGLDPDRIELEVESISDCSESETGADCPMSDVTSVGDFLHAIEREFGG